MSIVTPVPRGVIETQVAKILASELFVDTTRLNRFLEFVVTQSLAGNGERLKGYTIGVEVFDRPVDFDPTIDTIVRVQAGKLRQRLDLYYADEGRTDPVRIRIPKGHYSPVFELALSEEAGEEDNEEDLPASQVVPEDTFQGPSIAVMPFDNLSGDPAQEYFADGMTEEIINLLTKFRELRVISRHSTFRYKHKHADARELGTALGVQFILEGSVRRWENQIRVTMQLILAADGGHLLSENYNRELTAANLFEIQDDIAAQVAAEIAEPHGVLSRFRATNARWDTDRLDAYDCRMLASEYWRSPNGKTHQYVREQLERAVRLDPDYSGAWAMLAIIYGDEERFGFNYLADPLPLDRALSAACTAVEKDPRNAAGYHALFMTHFHRGEFNRFETAAAKALQFNPNYPDMLADLAVCRGFLGDWETGDRLASKAIALSPNPPGWYDVFPAINHYRMKQYDEALSAARQIGTGAGVFGPAVLAMVLAQLGQLEEAKAQLQPLADMALIEVIQSAARLWHIPPDLLAHMAEGWAKIGLRIVH